MSLAHASVSALRNCLVQVVRNADSFALRLLQRTEYALEQSLSSNSAIFADLSMAVRRAALHNLQQHRSQLISSFPHNLLESLILFAREPFAFTSQTLDTDLLLLIPMAESASRQLKLEKKLVKLLAPQVELALADLDALMSGAQGHEWVQPESNPLRVENYVRALGQSISAVQPALEVVDCWQHFMGMQLGSLLSSEYVRTTQLLRQQEVSPAPYAQVEQMNELPAQSLLTLRLLQELATDLRWIDDPQLTVPQVLTSSMLDGWQATVQSSGLSTMATLQGIEPGLQTEWTSYSSTVLQSQMLPTLSDAGWVQRPRPQSNLQLRTLQRMMSHMTADARLLPKVQAVLRLLEPALGQIAQTEPAFFDDGRHPARQLLDELTARSLWFATESVAGYAHFIGVAEQVARALARQPFINASVFAGALQQMREQWPPEGRLSAMAAIDTGGGIGTQLNLVDGAQSTQGMMSSALGLVERHAAMLEQQAAADSSSLSQIIRALPSAEDAAEDIVDFVCGPWSDVIFEAQKKDGSKDGSATQRDPGGYLALVPSLLWSVSPQAAQDAGRLVAIAPKLQRRLARGLRSVGRSEVEIAALAARIAGLHQYHLDAAQAAVQPRPDLFAPTTLLNVLEDATSDEASDDSAGNLDTTELAPAIANLEYSSLVVAVDAGVQSKASAGNEEWLVGVWVELSNERKQLRTQLTWVSPQQSLFLFTAEDGSTQSMTRRMRDKLLSQGQLWRLEAPA